MTTERKTVPPPSGEGSLKKVLGAVDAYALGIGSMVGFGWVVLTGEFIRDAGTIGAVTAMIMGGIVMGVVGLTYAELTSAMPRAGGEHNYLLRGMGARWSFIGSWGITGGYVTIVAFEAVALPRTVEYIFPGMSQISLWTIFGSDVYLTWALVGAAAAVVITGINIIGIKQAGITQTFVVLFLLIVGLLLITGSLTGGSTGNMDPWFTGSTGMFTVLIAVPFLYVGFDVIPQTAEELNLHPRRIGKLIVISVLMATAWYVMTMVTVSTSMPAGLLAETDLATADAMDALFNSEVMAKVLLGGGIAGILTSWNSLLIGASRLAYAMGRTGMLPQWFGRLNPHFGTPVNALVFIGALSILAPFFGPGMLGWLVSSGSPSIVIAYLLVSIVFVLLRRREPDMNRPFRVGRGRSGVAVGFLAIALCVGLLALYVPGMPADIGPVPYLLFGLWWLLGLYFLVRIPKGIQPGPHAEEELMRRQAANS